MAREIRTDPRANDSGRWGCAWLLSCIVLILMGAARTSEDEVPDPMCAVGGLGIVAWVAWLCKSYRCPVCGDRLEMRFVLWRDQEDRADRKPVYHVCPRCDVEWDFGLAWYRENSD